MATNAKQVVPLRAENDNPLNNLRKPFPDHQISKLPKESRKQIDERKADRSKVVFNCRVCGGIHHKDAVHLDYVGHAALTDRLLDTDITWSWEPLAFDANGLPALDRNGGLWIKLTVAGVTRLGYGAADGKQGGDAVKEIIGDALRNAAMRFGAALDLWHKGDLHADDEPVTDRVADAEHYTPAPRQRPAPLTGPIKTRAEARVRYGEIVRELHACGDSDMLQAFLESISPELDQFRDELPSAWNGDGADFIGLKAEVANAHSRFDTTNAG